MLAGMSPAKPITKRQVDRRLRELGELELDLEARSAELAR